MVLANVLGGELKSQLDDLRVTLYVDWSRSDQAKIKHRIREYSYYPAELCPLAEESPELEVGYEDVDCQVHDSQLEFRPCAFPIPEPEERHLKDQHRPNQ
jgi:hypothetical protein